MNEIIFLFYTLTINLANIIAVRISKELLIALICLQCVLINLFVTKEITLFGLTATASDSLAVSITLSLNLLQEFYNKEIALKTIWYGFYCAIFYTITSLFHLAYMPALTDTANPHFVALLTPMPRIILASLTSYLITQNIDAHFYAYLTKKFKDKHYIFRNYTSVSITQLLDTIIFSFLGLYKLNESFSNINTIFQIIILSYTIKLITIIISAPFLAISKKIINKYNN